VNAIRDFLERRGYRAFMLVRRRLRPVEEFDLARHQDSASVRIDAIVDGRTYVNNFAFVHDPVLIDRLSDLAARGQSL
jgi:hypothetical protein